MSDYLERQKESGIRVGDRVKVTRIASDYEGNWGTHWTSRMNETVGKVWEVTANNSDHGFKLNDGSRCVFPYFVLEKVSAKLELDIKYKYLAKDECGSLYFYLEMPVMRDDSWNSGSDYVGVNLSLFSITHMDSLDWKNSLHEVSPDGTITEVKNKHVITIDGKDIELSSESFENLKNQLN